jgi:hypothetical protein
MTIAVVSQHKYHLQRLATFWCAVECWDVLERIVAEERGGEDSTLTVSKSGQTWTLELQVKGERADVDVAAVAQWLAHFPERRAQTPLLERVGNDLRRMALFVASGRCRDAVRSLCSRDIRIEPHRYPIGDADAGALRDAFAVAWAHEDRSDLDERRNKYCGDFATRTNLAALKQLLRRVVVVEQIDESEIERRCSTILTHTFRIPSGVVGQTLAAACDVIRDSLGSGNDLRPLLKATLDERSVDRLFHSPGLYVPRGDEPALVDRLRSENVLLLRGAPLSGKTFTARWIAQRMQDKGIHCRETFVDLPELYRFLIASEGTEERLAVFHDPFGALAPSEDAPERRRLLDDILSALAGRPHRRILLTSRSTVLNAIASPSEWVAAGYRWYDLGAASAARTAELWRHHANALSLTAEQTEHVLRELAGNALEPGACRQLALHIKREGGTPDRATLLQAALVDAVQLGNHFRRHANVARVLSALSVCATTTVFASEQHLAHVLSSFDALPGRGPSHRGRGFNLGGKNVEAPPDFPRYDESVRLIDQDRHLLAELTSDGLLDRAQGWRFSHPIHEAAALQVLARATESTTYLRRAIFSLDSRLGVLATQRLEHLARVRQDLRDALVGVLLEATDSIFPSVVDGAIETALNGFAQEDVALTRFISVLQSAFSKRNDLLWHQGRAWYDPREVRSGIEVAMQRIFGPSQPRVKAAREQLARLDQGAILDEESLYVLVREAAEAKSPLDERVVTEVTSSDVALIRAIAAEALILQKDARAQRVLEHLDKERSPIVLWYVVKSFAMVWRDLRAEEQRTALSQIKAGIHSNRGAILLSRLLGSVSNDEFQDHDQFAWDFWVSVLTELLRALPPALGFNESAVFSGAREAVAYVEPSLIATLAEAWITWLETRVAHAPPTDYALMVVSLLLDATKATPQLRAPFLRRFCSQPDTGVQAVFVADLVGVWSNLSEAEKDLLLGLLQSDRQDQRWLRAFALTGHDVPREILASLSLPPDVFETAPHEIIRLIEPQLLADSVAVWTGAPQPLWRLGKHHRNRERWAPILLEIARVPSHPLFEQAIREGLNRLLDDGPFLEVWREVCAAADPAVAARMFRELLRACVAINGAQLDEHWASLLACPAAEELVPNWMVSVLDNIESLDFNDNISVVGQDPRFGACISAALKEELDVYVSVSAALKTKRGSYKRRDALAAAKVSASQVRWRLMITHSKVQDLLCEEAPDDDWLDACWERFHDATRRQDRSQDDQYRLPDWISLSDPADRI